MSGRLTNNYKQRNDVVREKHRNVITETSHLITLDLILQLNWFNITARITRQKLSICKGKTDNLNKIERERIGKTKQKR